MILSKIVDYEDNREDFHKLLELRYNSYVKELNYIAPKAEFDLLKMEFDQYDLHSEHIILINEDDIVACARIIKDSEFGLPIFNKVKLTENNLFLNKKNVEVSRLIVKKQYRSTRVFLNLIQEVFMRLLTMDCTYVLADTFINSKSYKMLRSLGFKKFGLEYRDLSFNINTASTLLYCNMDEIIDSLLNYPNKSQAAFLKNIKLKSLTRN